MQSLSNELRGVIENRLRSADPREILAIASTLCAQENGAAVATLAKGPQPPAGQRFLHGDGVVRDTTTGLTWTHENVGKKRYTWSNAKAAAAAVRLDGHEDWRLPTIQELLTLVDYSRTEPAIDTTAFECESAWYWSATPYSSSPGVYAWYVHFDYGLSGCYDQDSEACVRAVRAGQLIGSLV